MPIKLNKYNLLKNNKISPLKKAPKGLGKARRQFPAASTEHLSAQIDNRLSNCTLGFDGLGVRLIVALRHDQVDQLVRQLDV